jgi:Kae1-associated kinase Bud32
MKLIAQGAEARLFEKEGTIIKERFCKSYRIEEIDFKLRGSRTRREAKVITRLQQADFPCPPLIECDEEEKIIMQKIDGQKVRDILEKSDYVSLSNEIGEKIAKMHNLTIIHGDLTTSNMIFSSSRKEIFFIDFGLSFFSHKIEDKAVDLHLLKQALESKHYTIWEDCFKTVLSAYTSVVQEGELILKRLEDVEKRGRYKKH